MRKILFPILVFSLPLTLAGCAQTSPSSHQAQSAGASTPTSGTLIVEPQAGLTPYLSLVQPAEHSMDVNSYLLTDRDLVSALVEKAQSGLTVRVIVDGHPYEDQQAVPQERAEFAGTKVQLKLAPA